MKGLNQERGIAAKFRRSSQALWRAARSTSGVSSVEFALTFIVLMAALLGVVEAGRLAYAQTALFFAAQEATRFAVVREGIDDAAVEAFARSRLIGLTGINVITATSPVSAVTDTSLVTVTITYNHPLIWRFLDVASIPLSAESSGFYAFPEL